MVRAFTKLAAPLQRRVRLMVSRGVLRLVNDATKLQELQLGLLADEVRDKVERMQDYGFSSHPHPGAEAIVVCVGGSRDHAVCIKVDDRRYRFSALEQGEVALYTDEGDSIRLKRNREIHVKGGTKVVMETAALEIKGIDGGNCAISIIGDIEQTGGINSSGSIIDGSGNTNHHSH